MHSLETHQVDYALAQADLNNDVFTEISQGFEHLNKDGDMVLKLNKLQYEITNASLIYFKLLKTNSEKVGFKQYKHVDSCLFVCKKAICLI